MKKALLFIASVLIALPEAKAFEPIKNNEISAQYAVFTGNQIVTFFKGAFTGVTSLGNFSCYEITGSGMFILQYHHAGDENIMYGFSVGYESVGQKLKDKNDVPVERMLNTHCFSILGSGKIYYKNFPHFGMYAKIQAGVELASGNMIEDDHITEEKKIKPHLAFQGTPLGLEFGGKTLRGFAEIGIGTQGIWSIGIKKQF